MIVHSLSPHDKLALYACSAVDNQKYSNDEELRLLQKNFQHFKRKHFCSVPFLENLYLEHSVTCRNELS